MSSITTPLATILATTGQATDEELLALGVLLMIVVISLLIGFAISIVIAALLYTIQKRVPAEHQKIDPLMVWLLLIPVFNLIWNFFVFLRIPESYQSHFQAHGRTDVGDCGKSIGLWYAICAVCSIVPCINYLAGPAALVLLIIFLVKLFGLRSQIQPA